VWRFAKQEDALCLGFVVPNIIRYNSCFCGLFYALFCIAADPLKSFVVGPKRVFANQKTPVLVHPNDKNAKPVISENLPFEVKTDPPCDLKVFLCDFSSLFGLI